MRTRRRALSLRGKDYVLLGKLAAQSGTTMTNWISMVIVEAAAEQGIPASDEEVAQATERRSTEFERWAKVEEARRKAFA